MRDRAFEMSDVLVPRPIDNSQVVREVDPQASRNLWVLLALLTGVLGGAVFYAWPHVMTRQTDDAAQRLARQRDRLVEQNRQLRLEKAGLEDLARVEAIARRDLGLTDPDPARLVVIEPPAADPGRVQVASQPESAARN